MTEEPHEVLGVDENATLDEIERAFRRKAMESHPDTGGDRQEFQRVANAYELLVQQHGSTESTEPVASSFYSYTREEVTSAKEKVPSPPTSTSGQSPRQPEPMEPLPVAVVPKPPRRWLSVIFEVLFAGSALIIFLGLIILVFAIGAVSRLSRQEQIDSQDSPPAIENPIDADNAAQQDVIGPANADLGEADSDDLTAPP